MILNIITKNDPDCMLTLTSAKDVNHQSFLLLNEGVMLLQHENFLTIENVTRIFFMAEDAEARGISKVMPSDATAIDYEHFVHLVAEHDSVVTW